MKHEKYELSDALDRMSAILSGNGEQYRKFSYIPEPELLEDNRGSFVDCVAIVSRLYFVEKDINILGLAKIFDIYQGEAKMILAESSLCRKVTAQGYTITGIYNIGTSDYMSDLLDVAGKLGSLPSVINTKVGRKDNPIIKNVCALEKGVLFVTQTTEGIDYFGNMLNRAECWLTNAVEKKEKGIYVSEHVRSTLKSRYQEFFHETDDPDVLHGNVENIGMARWIKEQ